MARIGLSRGSPSILPASMAYQIVKRDGVSYPTLADGKFSVGCLAYRGGDKYFVEIRVTNNSDQPITLPPSFVKIIKPDYEVAQSMHSRSR